MPNWCEGNLRIRGKRENILEYLKNELVCVGRSKWVYDDGNGGHQEYLAEDTAPIIEVDKYDCISAKVPNLELYSDCMWIKNSRRAFVAYNSGSFESYIDGDDEEPILYIEDFKQAWCIDSDVFRDASEKYNIDFHIFGWECGMMFSQEVEIIKGEVTKDESTKYDLWDNPLPHVGG